MASYICCGCDVDMTQAVEAAFERISHTERITVDRTERKVRSVLVTCPNGHSCVYTR